MRTATLLAAAISILLVASIAHADSGTYSMSGGFTSFSGNVGGNADPNYIRAVGLNQITCGAPGCSGFSQICPDAGCASDGPRTAASLLSVGLPTNFLTFQSFGCPPAVSPICANTPNELDFVPATDSILGLNQNTGQTEMLLGSLTFTNGIWTGDADFGFTVTATDIASPHNSYTFTGNIDMQLNSAPPGLTNPAQIAYANADCISLTNQAGQPVSTFEDRNFCVYELNNGLGFSNTATVNLYGTIGSLDPLRFGDLTGGGFVVPVESTPEPKSGPLMGTVLIVAYVIYRRRGRAQQTS